MIDIVVKAYDDIDAETVAPAVTVTKGAPCTSADTCAKGQKCEEGRCFWDPPAGQLGDPCEYNQFCISNNCISTTAGDQYCSQPCVVGVEDSCPMGFMCTGEAGQSGLCVFTPDSGGTSRGMDRRSTNERSTNGRTTNERSTSKRQRSYR